MKKTSDILKALREDSDLKQIELAAEFNINRSTIANYENGNATPSVDVLIKYAEKFNTSIDYLLGRVKEKNWATQKTDKMEIVYTSDIDINEMKLRLIQEAVEEYKVNNLLKNKK